MFVGYGTHSLDKMLAWFGSPKTISYFDDNFGGVEANCRCSMEFDNEFGHFTGSLYFSKTATLRNSFVLEADEYRAELVDNVQISLYPVRLPGTRMFVQAEPAPQNVDTYQLQLQHFARAIHGIERPLINGRQAAESLRFIEYCYSNRQQLEEPWAWYQHRSAVNA